MNPIKYLYLLAFALNPLLAQEEVSTEIFSREVDFSAWTAADPGFNGHASLLRPDASVWSYWAAPRTSEWQDDAYWQPITFAGSGLFQERTMGTGEHRYFRLHDYFVDAESYGLFWNRHEDLEPGHLADQSLLVVFTAPVSGIYRLEGDFLWQHWPGPGIHDGLLQIWQLRQGTPPALLSQAQLQATISSKEFKPVSWNKDIFNGDHSYQLKAGERFVVRLVGSRNQYRGVTIQDDGFHVDLIGAPPLPRPKHTEAAVRTRQLQSLLDPYVPALEHFRELAENGNFEAALAEFQDVFLDLAATLHPVNLPTQWLYGDTRAKDVRQGRIKTLIYGGNETLTFEIGAPGEVPWTTLGRERYPLLLRDLSTMHWASALADPKMGGGKPGDAALWFGYWADLAERWTVAYDWMRNDTELLELLPQSSIKWPGAAPLYYGWRSGNFFSWLPEAAVHTRESDGVGPNPLDLASVVIWFAAEEIPEATRNLDNPSGVPNQRRLLAAGLLQAGATMQWFRNIASAVESAQSFIMENAHIEMLPDGGSLEYSLNYNKHLPEEIDNYLAMNANLPEQYRFTPPIVEFLQRARAYRYALIAAILRPDGTPPAIGKNNPYRAFDPWPEDLDHFPLTKAIHEAFNGDTSMVDFTSVYFPWVGYAALRSNWSEGAAYSIFQNNRPGLGHQRESVLRLDISAYGSPLLVNSGSEQYSSKGNFSAYFNATASQNSISVDGYTQLNQSRKRNLPYKSPIQALWFTSDEVDFVEGRYDGPYGGWNFDQHGTATKDRHGEWEKQAIIKDVEHHRQVIFLRNVPAWVVIDEVDSNSSRSFTQTWNFAPGFGEDSVQIAPNECHIFATSSAGPSVELLQIFDSDVDPTYEVYRGVHEPDRILGWVSKDKALRAYDFAAANDLHVTWRSSSRKRVITVIVPSPDSQARIVEKSQESGRRHIRLQSGETITIEPPSDGDAETTIRLAAIADNSTEKNAIPPALEITIYREHVTITDEFNTPQQATIPAGFFWEQQTGGVWFPRYNLPNRTMP